MAREQSLEIREKLKNVGEKMWMHSRNGPTPAAVVYSCSFLLPPGKQPFLSCAGLIWPQLRGIISRASQNSPGAFRIPSQQPSQVCFPLLNLNSSRTLNARRGVQLVADSDFPGQRPAERIVRGGLPVASRAAPAGCSRNWSYRALGLD